MWATAIGRYGPVQLHLIGAFALHVDGHRLHLGRREERLIAFLAMRGPCHRPYVAGTLWPDSDESHALNNLRAAVLRVRRAAPQVLDVDRSVLALQPDVRVDLLDVVDCAERVVEDNGCDPERSEHLLGRGELLSGWYDDWVMFERERLHHRRIRALEVLAVQELENGNPELALVAARDAAALEPLRESACRLVIRAHLALGNRAQAAGVFADYEHGLARDLGIEPSPDLVREMRDGLGREQTEVVRSPAPRRA